MLSECPQCGGSVRHVERTNRLGTNNHHNSYYKCGECGRRILSG